MYWERARSKQLSRRRFLGAAGASLGAAGLSVIGCGGGNASPGPPPATPTARPQATASATASASPTNRLSERHGETLRYAGFVASDGIHDPHKTQAGPFYGQQALVFSRLLNYADQVKGTIQADLAAALPEQPDALTFTFRLNPAARWHDRAPLNGRAVTAEDVKFSIERQLNGDASFVRKSRWTGIEKVEVPEPGLVKVTVTSPLATMLPAFADVNSYIVAPQLSIEGRDIPLELQVGSGPFRWVEWQEGKFASVSRNGTWHGVDRRPYLDGVTLTQPKDATEIEARFRTKALDVATVGRPQAEQLKRATPGLQEATAGHSQFFGMRFFTGQAPFNDTRFRSAVSIAPDRREMITQFFAGSGAMNPWVSWPLTRWSLPQAELTTLPGYRPGETGRAQDIIDAKALLAAYVKEHPITTDLPLYVVDEVEASVGLGEMLKRQLKETLDLNVSVQRLKLDDLVGRMLKGQGEAAWAAGPDSGPLDLDDWLHPYFHSSGTKNTFALRNPDLDVLIAAQRAELDETKRREIGHRVQRSLFQTNVGVNFVSERVVVLSQPYVKNFPLDATDGYQHRFADTWLDRADPSFRGRGTTAGG